MKVEIDFIKLIKDDKTAPVNRDGLKPLFELAESIKLEKCLSTKKNIEKLFYNIDFNEFNSEELSTYLSFIYYAGFRSDIVFVKIQAFLKTNILSNATEVCLRKGLLIRFLIERKPDTFSIQSLLDESGIREKAPWIWIDCISHYSFSLAIKEITAHINEVNSIRNLIVRIPTFLKRYGKDELRNAFIDWHSNIIDSKSRASLDSWATNLQIKIGMSISAEVRFKKLSFYQETLM